MPELSLVVCVHRERDYLRRLLDHASGCYDDLVVVHDGPDEDDISSLATSHAGRFFVRPRRYCQEQHWAFAWEQARHDWILRWDADEFPSDGLKNWLAQFRREPEPSPDVSGYACIWPLWDGRRARTRNWPRRVFLVNRRRVRYFGMIDQSPIADCRFADLDLVLHHQPLQANYGIRYTIANPKVQRWHRDIARCLLGKPTDLPCWRWDDPEWPRKWEQIRRRPLWTGLKRLVLSPLWNARDMIAYGELPWPPFLISFPLQHWMTCMAYARARREQIRS